MTAATDGEQVDADRRAPVAVIVPAKDEAARIGATVRAVSGLPGVAAVVVVDDGSSDRTASLASSAGAEVVRLERSYGKADALMSGLGRVAGLQRVGRLGPDAVVLLAGADLETSAGDLGVLVDPVAQGEADLTIAAPPSRETEGGGLGLVVGLARRGVEELTGVVVAHPLSGLRCLSPAAVTAATPFARGWGVEVGMTVDVLDAGLVVREVPCDLRRRVTGSDWRAQVHRAAQYRDIALALGVRRLRRRLGPA